MSSKETGIERRGWVMMYYSKQTIRRDENNQLVKVKGENEVGTEINRRRVRVSYTRDRSLTLFGAEKSKYSRLCNDPYRSGKV